MTRFNRRLFDYCHEHKILVASAALVFVVGLIRQLWKIGDFEVYFAASSRFLHGASIHVVETNPFTYPTATALLFVPLTQFGHTLAKGAFFTISFVLLLIGISLTNRGILDSTSQPARTRRIVFFAAFLFSLRYILAAFDNQQTDLIIFGLISIGIYLYQSKNNAAAIAWSVPIILKANPMFMILLPIFQRRWKVALSMVALVVVFASLPDLLKYLIETDVTVSNLMLPANVIPRSGIIEQKVFGLFPIAETPLAYLREYVSLNFADVGRSWWENVSNPKNQSLTRIILYFAPLELNGNYVFVSLCIIFSGALLFLSVKSASPKNIFITGVLFYAAFVLIGPHSSKPHFVMIYGLLLYCFQHLSQHFSSIRLCFLSAIGIMLGFTSSGFLAKYADQLAIAGHIGLTAFVLWAYTYVLVLNDSREKSEEE